MVKKIKLDFSKVEERSGFNTKQMPEGLHGFTIVGVEDKEASDGTDMWVFSLVPTNPKYKTRRFPFYCKLQQNQLWKVRDLFVAAGVPVPKRAVTLDPNKVVGKTIAAEVEDDNYQGNLRSTINGVYSIDILEDDAAGDEPEDDEELDGDEVDEDEYEDDETEELADEEYEDEEDDSDEEEDDLDEDDLDDEDLEDDEDEELYDDEDDEEEPEPAPKRRAPAKAAPAKKSPAKTPAKRAIKRR